MPGFFTLVIIGFIAQLIDGSLGMAYGVSTSTLMLSAGLVPVLASASIHLAELGTTASSAFSHWRFGNVDRGKVLWLGLPGAVAAFFGAVALSSLSAQAARPWVAVILAGLGVHILIRFAFRARTKPVVERPIAQRFLVPLGLVAGFMDALGGGGWGPIATPTLLASGRMQPARVVGTVDTSEFLVALGASAGFLLALDFRHVPWVVVGALLLGGVVAAPVAAYLVRLVPVRIMGTAVGGLILITNARTLLAAWSLPADGVSFSIGLLWLAALVHAVSLTRREHPRHQAPARSLSASD
ncbi:MAG TPA: sulfite exporter TauE/SafE family protein [Bacillota bacterium]